MCPWSLKGHKKALSPSPVGEWWGGGGGWGGERDCLFLAFESIFFGCVSLTKGTFFLQIVQLFAKRSQIKSRAVSDCCLSQNSELNCLVLCTLTGCRQGSYLHLGHHKRGNRLCYFPLQSWRYGECIAGVMAAANSTTEGNQKRITEMYCSAEFIGEVDSKLIFLSV